MREALDINYMGIDWERDNAITFQDNDNGDVLAEIIELLAEADIPKDSYRISLNT